MVIGTGKFATQFSGRNVVRSSRGLDTVKLPKRDISSFNHDPRTPLTGPLFNTHSLEPGNVIPMQSTLISELLTRTSGPKVTATIVESISVDVVNRPVPAGTFHEQAMHIDIAVAKSPRRRCDRVEGSVMRSRSPFEAQHQGSIFKIDFREFSPRKGNFNVLHRRGVYAMQGCGSV